MRTYKILQFLIFISSAMINAQDWKILETSSNRLVIEYNPKFYPAKKQIIENKEYQFHDFQNSSSIDNLIIGNPDIRFRSFLIQLPSRINPVISILQNEFEIFNNVSIIPVPSKIKNSETYLLEKVYKEKITNESVLFQPAKIEQIGDVQGKLIGALKVFPLEYNSVTKSLKKYSRVVVQIDFENNINEFIPKLIEDLPSLNNGQNKIASSKTSRIRNVEQSPFSTGKNYKIEITEDGMYKIDYTYLKNLGIEPTSFSSINDLKIYGNNGSIISRSIKNLQNIPYPQLAVDYVDNNQNSKFDIDDYVIFYAKGSFGWNYNSANKSFDHYLNPYSNSNYVFLQILSGSSKIKSVEKISPQGTTNGIVASTTGKYFFDEEKTNLTQSGLEWYSAPMTDNTSRILSNKLHGYFEGTAVQYSYEFLSRSPNTAQFILTENNNSVSTIVIPGMSNSELYGDPIGEYSRREKGTKSIIPTLTDSRSNFKINYVVNFASAIGYINWVEILYKQKLQAVNDNLFFTSPDSNSIVEFQIDGFTSNQIQIYDVSDYLNLKKINNIQLQQLQGTFTFKDNLKNGEVKTYWAGTSSTYKTLKAGILIPNSNILGEITGAEFVIISHRNFISDANRLKTHKEQLPQLNKLKTIVVDVDTLLNEFGFGISDPVAIRNYLLLAKQQWQIIPRYVLFFGDGNFDFRNIMKIDNNLLPTFQTDNSNIQISSYNYDDFFVMLDSLNSNTVSLAHGRLPAKIPSDSKQLVDKIISYETKPPLDQWKNLITISADDRNINNNIDGADNEEQAERLAREFIPSLYEVKKIFIGDYPTTISSAGRRKPEARSELLKQVNSGTLLLNYTGHGNPKVWAHENILTKEDVKVEFKNGNRLPLIVAATCDWARFDEVGENSSAEEAMLNSKGGAIGVISATRAVFSGPNAELNYAFYKFMFPLNPFTPVSRIGDALLLAKNDPASGSSENNQKFHLLGDPTIRLAVPQYYISIDSLNGKKFSPNSKDTLRALEKITFVASVKDQQNNIQTGINGTALLSVFDSERSKTISDLGITFSFVEQGAVIFRGEHSLVNGKMEAKFIVPKDISYENKRGRISIYFSSTNIDGRGNSNDLIIGGTSTTSYTDKKGPEISIFLDRESFQSGDFISESPTLFVHLSDSSGINATGSGIGHRLEAWLDDNKQSIDLNNYYRSSRDNYQKGVATYKFENLETGKHKILVKGWDVYNNSSEKISEFSVSSSTTLSLSQVYNIPNPARSSTRFTFQHNQLQSIDIEINIYTIAGRLIRKIEIPSVTDRFVVYDYDCRDEDGDELANGIYIYKITATTIDSQLTNEAISKLVIMK